MPTTSIRPGHPYGSPIEWGEGWSDEEQAALTSEFISRLVAALEVVTGDPSIDYHHYDGGVYFECRGVTDDDGHCFDPITPWTIEPEWRDIWHEVGESVMRDAEEILK